jgi:hypothetical protein
VTITPGKRAKIIGFRVDAAAHRALVAAAARERRPLSSFCRNVITEYLAYVARQSRRNAARDAARDRQEPQRADAEIGASAA